jgi:hypothetical protein
MHRPGSWVIELGAALKIENAAFPSDSHLINIHDRWLYGMRLMYGDSFNEPIPYPGGDYLNGKNFSEFYRSEAWYNEIRYKYEDQFYEPKDPRNDKSDYLKYRHEF